jgi:hypothetical protein
VVEEIDLWRGGRDDRGGDAGLIHIVERSLRRPIGHRRVVALDLFHRVEPGRRRNVVVHVDAVGLGLRRSVAGRGGQCADAQRGDAAGHEFAPAHVRGAAGAAPEQRASTLAHGVLP